MDINYTNSEITDISKTLEFRCCENTVSMAPFIKEYWPVKKKKNNNQLWN